MLSLSRKQGESVILIKEGQVICTVNVKRLHQNHVQVTFEAEEDVIILREEIASNFTKEIIDG